LLARDEIDTGRTASPLVMAEGAVHVDGTAYSLEDVVDLVVSLVESAAGLNREGTP
jgi:CMP/dCMP kinase